MNEVNQIDLSEGQGERNLFHPVPLPLVHPPNMSGDASQTLGPHNQDSRHRIFLPTVTTVGAASLLFVSLRDISSREC